MKVLKDPSFQLSISLLYIPRRGTLWLKYDILRALRYVTKLPSRKDICVYPPTKSECGRFPFWVSLYHVMNLFLWGHDRI